MGAALTRHSAAPLPAESEKRTRAGSLRGWRSSSNGPDLSQQISRNRSRGSVRGRCRGCGAVAAAAGASHDHGAKGGDAHGGCRHGRAGDHDGASRRCLAGNSHVQRNFGRGQSRRCGGSCQNQAGCKSSKGLHIGYLEWDSQLVSTYVLHCGETMNKAGQAPVIRGFSRLCSDRGLQVTGPARHGAELPIF